MLMSNMTSKSVLCIPQTGLACTSRKFLNDLIFNQAEKILPLYSKKLKFTILCYSLCYRGLDIGLIDQRVVDYRVLEHRFVEKLPQLTVHATFCLSSNVIHVHDY